MTLVSKLALCVVLAFAFRAEASYAPVLVLDPHIGQYPVTIHAKIYVEPDYQNVMLCVEWVGEAYAEDPSNGPDGKDCWSLDGQYDHLTYYHDIKNLLPGKYLVHATVLRVRGSEQSIRQSIQILESIYPLPH